MTAPLVVRKFVKKPLPVEMVQFTETNGEELAKWINDHFQLGSEHRAFYFPHGGTLGTKNPPCIRLWTLEGYLTAKIGDWIVRGVEGEHYPIADGVKSASYDPLCEHCGTAHRDCDPCP